MHFSRRTQELDYTEKAHLPQHCSTGGTKRKLTLPHTPETQKRRTGVGKNPTNSKPAHGQKHAVTDTNHQGRGRTMEATEAGRKQGLNSS